MKAVRSTNRFLIILVTELTCAAWILHHFPPLKSILNNISNENEKKPLRLIYDILCLH